MQDEFNPYAAPATSMMHPRAAEWLHSTNDPSLQKVARGLGLIHNGIITIVLAIIFGLLGMFVIGIAAGEGGLRFVMIIAFLVGFVGMIMIVVGTLMCLATPAETGAKGLVTASVILSVISFCASVIAEFAENDLVQIIGTLAGIGSQITFLLFLKQLSEFIGAISLAERAKTLLILMAVVFGLQVIALVAVVVVPVLIAVIGLAMLVIGLISFFMYLRLLDGLRKAIQSGGTVYS
jgi:hypothetical protein